MNFYIIVPVFNEENSISEVVDSLTKEYSKSTVIVVDDGSSDKTELLLSQININNLIKIRLPSNKGKGAALKKGLSKVLEIEKKPDSSVVIFFDSDLEINTSEIQSIINFYNNNTDIQAVFGSRFLNKNNFKNYGVKFIINYSLTFLSNLITQNKLTDMETALKSFKVNLIKKIDLKSERFDIEPEVVFKLSKLKIKIIEVPINYIPRSKKEGKKMSFKGGIDTLIALLKFAFKK
jgi:glycosyltransferase involved in cell wall biosynthesis